MGGSFFVLYIGGVLNPMGPEISLLGYQSLAFSLVLLSPVHFTEARIE